jgi:hypothetical protein
MPVKTLEKILHLYREKYFDFNVRHFHEKVIEEHGLKISYTWVKMALTGSRSSETAGGERTGGGGHGAVYRECCCTSMPANMPGFRMGAYWDLLTILDDATSEIYYARALSAGGSDADLDAGHTGGGGKASAGATRWPTSLHFLTKCKFLMHESSEFPEV